MAWMKLEDTAYDHPKIRKLARRLRIEEVTALGMMTSLWTWCLRHAPDGNLTKFDIDDIELAAKWVGEPGDFYRHAVELTLIDKDDETTGVHGWMRRAENFKTARS